MLFTMKVLAYNSLIDNIDWNYIKILGQKPSASLTNMTVVVCIKCDIKHAYDIFLSFCL